MICRANILLFLVAGFMASASEPVRLLPQAQVSSAGVFLDEIASTTNSVLPHLRLSVSPRFGQTLVLSRKQIEAALVKSGDVNATNFAGATEVRLTRKTRSFDEEELRLLVNAQLQQDVVKDRGELELRLSRPWTAINVPDEPISVRVTDLPATGISALFVCRVELSTTNETVGAWQTSLSAKVWREVWTSRTALRRGALLADADLVRERRDVLSIRDPLADFTVPDPSFETAEYIAPNAPLLLRSIKVKPAVRRGQSAEAMVQDGALSISMKVEVLEDGTPGQVIRVRNPQTKRELRGRVQNEQTILVTL